MLVYIIDDEPKIRRGLAHVVASHRPQWPAPATAGDAETALRDPAFWRAELLFLDIRLPGIDGLELLSRVRQERRTDVMVIVISGHAEFSFAQQAIQMQVSDYLLKPIELKRVYEVLDAAEAQWNKRREVLEAITCQRQGAAAFAAPGGPDRADLPELYRVADQLPSSSLEPGQRRQRELPSDQTVYIESFIAGVTGYSLSVQKVIASIIQNFALPLDLSTVSAHVHLHKNYLSDLFKRETGVNLSCFITDYRLFIAKEKLRGGSAKITGIAKSVGFNDDHYFSQVFSKRVGTTPKKYRLLFS